MDDLFEKTARLYQNKLVKPKVTAKLLQKPPFRFLHDVVMGLMQITGYPEGIFTENDCKPAYVAEFSENKISFLSKLIEKVSDTLGVPVDLKPSKVVAGLEPEKTCLFLGALYKAATGESIKRGIGGVEKMSESLLCDEKKDTENLEIYKIENSLGVGYVKASSKQEPEIKQKIVVEDEKTKLIQEEIENNSNLSDFNVIESDLNRDCKTTKNSNLKSVIPKKSKMKVKVKTFKSKPIKQETLTEELKPIRISRKKKHSNKRSSLNLEEPNSLQCLIQSLCSFTASLSNLFQDTPTMIHLMKKESNSYNFQKIDLAILKPLPSSNQVLAEIESAIRDTQLKIREATCRILRNSAIIKKLSQFILNMEEPRVENITVAVRIRPLNQRELTSGGESIWINDSISSIREKSGPRSFLYDQVYDEHTETSEIFKNQGAVVIEKCLDGYNGCIFCYGQTGSGKTHTMHGIRKSNPGITPLSIDLIFSMIQNSVNKGFLIRCSYIELYNESINDLLNPNLLNLQLAEDKRNGIKIIGVTEEVCTSSHQVFTLLQMGEKHKNVASTNYNQRSSRAHCIFRVIVESKNSTGRADVSVAALNLIDLAGSESADVHGPAASSARSKEMKYINRSLLTLGTVIMRLSDKKNNAPIPYRDSKLTRLLQPALEGDSKVSIICNISPCSDAYDETLSTLKFAQRAKKIKQTIIKNDPNDSKALLVKYEKEISDLQDKLREMEMKLTQEEKNATDLVVSNKMLKLQEAKEQADAKLDRILQEKLHLAEDLERLKSFIIHSEDVKPTKLLMKEEEKKSTENEFYRGQSRPRTLASKNPSKLENEFKEIDYRNELKGFDMDKNESLLIFGVEDIEKELEEQNNKKVFVSGLSETSQSDCLKIIDEQAKQIEELMKVIAMSERKKEEDDGKDRMIAELQKVIRDKDEEIEEIRDELKLCRNNLTKIQIAYRRKKKDNEEN